MTAITRDDMGTLLAVPETANPAPGLVLIHGYSGPNAFYEAELRKWNERGFAAIVPNLFRLCGHPDADYEKEGQNFQAQTSDAQFVAAVTTAFDRLRAEPGVNAQRVAAIGYCMGGRIGFHFAAATPALAGLVTFFPTAREEPVTERRPRLPWEAAAEVKCPTMVFFGSDEAVTLPPIQAKIRAALETTGQRIEWHQFAYGGHGFAFPHAAQYVKELAHLSFALTANFMDKVPALAR